MKNSVLSNDRGKAHAAGALLVFLSVLAVVLGCGKNVDRAAQLDRFATDLENLTAEINRKLDARPNSTGIAEAQAVLDARKDSLTRQFDEFKNLPHLVFPAEARKKFEERTARCLDSFQKTITSHLTDFAREPQSKEKLEKLVDTYTGMFKE